MKKELDELICKAFPNLYKDRRGNVQETCMVWGFPEDGWFSLIYECSDTIEKELLKIPEGTRPCAQQVKEKFGTLRFYMSFENDVIEKAIERAEERSAKECEKCGAEAILRGDFWVITLCDKCDEESSSVN